MFGSVPKGKKSIGVAFSLAPNTPESPLNPIPQDRMNLGRGDYFFLFIFSNSIITGLVEFVKDFLGFFFLDGYRKSGLSPDNPVFKSCQISSVWMRKPSSVDVIRTPTLPPFFSYGNLNLNYRFRFPFQDWYGNRVSRYNVELSPVSASLVVLLILEVSG